MENLKRCFWVNLKNPEYIQYHDEEWGVPVKEDQKHFEMLVLEGAQAGLSWESILKRRNGYRMAFHNFDPAKVAGMSDADLEICMQNKGIIRNRLKIWGTRKNAEVFLNIQKEFSSFNSYVWGFVGGKPLINKVSGRHDIKSQTPESQALSKDLKKRGMTFVGPTIIYAYMQAAGLVMDHEVNCFRYAGLAE